MSPIAISALLLVPLIAIAILWIEFKSRHLKPIARITNQGPQRTAQELLLAHLDRKQRRDYFKASAFVVIGSEGNRYVITRWWVGGVYAVRCHCRTPNERCLYKHLTYRLCAHPNTVVPVDDLMLAQKLFLESNEQAFLSVANVLQQRIGSR